MINKMVETRLCLKLDAQFDLRAVFANLRYFPQNRHTALDRISYELIARDYQREMLTKINEKRFALIHPNGK